MTHAQQWITTLYIIPLRKTKPLNWGFFFLKKIQKKLYNIPIHAHNKNTQTRESAAMTLFLLGGYWYKGKTQYVGPFSSRFEALFAFKKSNIK